jgi:integrase
LLLLARLGLRAGEIVALELADIRWDVGEIVVRGKGRLHDRLPLLDDVGESLTLYLREARAPSASRRVFGRPCDERGYSRSVASVPTSSGTAWTSIAACRTNKRLSGASLRGRI